MKALFEPVFLYNFVVGTFAPLIYIQSIIKLMEVFVRKGFPQDLSRKIIHIAAGSWVWVWPLMDPSDGWSYAFNVNIAVLWTLLFIVKGLTAGPEDIAVKTMTRTGDPKELLKGPLFFTLAMEFIGIFFFMTFPGVATMAYLGWGDGLAPYIGARYGEHKYKLLGRGKSIEGSVTVFVAGFLGALLLHLLVFGTLPLSALRIYQIAILGLVAVIAEAVSPADVDNLLIPAALLATYHLLWS